MIKLFKIAFVFFFGLGLLGTGLMLHSAVQVPVAHAAAEDDASPEDQVVRPDIPAPDFLPSPDTGQSGYDTQNYILNEAIPQGINIFIGLMGLLTFAGILFGAIQMLTAYGNDDKLTKAKTNLRYGLLGFLLIILAYGIVSVVVSISLPNEQDGDSATSFFAIPSAEAAETTPPQNLDIEEALDLLLPSQKDIIEDQDTQGRVSLPGGDFLGEIVPAVVTNVLYATAFLIFVAFCYGGTLLVIARGNEEAVTKAKNIVIYSAIALALLALGYAIVYGIANLDLTDSSNRESDEVFVNTEGSND
ncbi:MAG: hypothetical protein WC777_03700 [Candidatus Gracilibacteria bacterium]|jgi:hypothetical protein